MILYNTVKEVISKDNFADSFQLAGVESDSEMITLSDEKLSLGDDSKEKSTEVEKALIFVMEYFDLSITITINPISYLFIFAIVLLMFEVSKTLSGRHLNGISISSALKAKNE